MKRFPLNRRHVYWLFAISIAVIFAYLCLSWIDSLRGLRLEELQADQIHHVQIVCRDFTDESKQTVSCENGELIREFVALLKTASDATPHKCSSPLWITLYFRNGKTYQFDSLPGHHDEYYEFNMRQVHRVERRPFIRLLEKMGLKQVPTKCG